MSTLDGHAAQNGRCPAREFGFALHDVARLLRTYADQRARDLNMTRAQWAVLARLQRCEGVKQSELAEMLDLAPITLGAADRQACDAGLVERRDDANGPARQPALSHRKGRARRWSGSARSARR